MMDEKLRKRLGYEAIEQYDTERLAKLQEHYAAILELLGEDPQRFKRRLCAWPSRCSSLRMAIMRTRWRFCYRPNSRKITVKW